jgi:ApeA N-terminal domain 1
VDKQKVYLGYWWIPKDENPSSEEGMIAGSISISTNNEVEVEILGSFNDPFLFTGNTNFPVMHGTIKGNGGYDCVTLLNCRHRGDYLVNCGISSSKYTVDFVLLHPSKYTTADSSSFNKIRFKHDLLFDWIGRSAIDYDENFNPKKKEIEPIDVSIGSDKISIFNGVNRSNSRKNINFNQTAWIEINSPRYLLIEEWLDKFITPIRHFLTLATNIENKLLSLYLFLYEDEDDIQTKFPFEVIISGLEMEDNILSSSMFDGDVIFRYGDIAETNCSLELILNKWFTLFDRINTNNDNLIYLYTANKYVKGYQETAFLNLVQALDLYYDNILCQKVSSADSPTVSADCISVVDLKTIEDILARSSEELSPNAKKWIEAKIEYGYANLDKTTSFDKLKKMFDCAGSLSQDFSDDIDKLCKKIKDTRNYYTHHGKNSRKKAAIKEDLSWLTQSVSYLLLYFLLTELNFTDDNIKKMLNRNSKYNFAKDRIKNLL